MAHRSGDVAVVRSVGSPLAEDGQKSTLLANEDDTSAADNDEDGDLPQCKIKRNYSCNLCPFFSQNPRSFLYHSRDVHFDRIKIYECSQCLYASKHSQKLQRHINMIHVNGKNRMKRVAKAVKGDKKRELKLIKPKISETAPVACTAPEENRGQADVSPVSLGYCANEDEDDQYVDEKELLDKVLKCSVCNFVTRSPSLMRRHERVVHLKKRFLRCSKCSYVTHVKARFTKHVKYHSMPMIKCDLCDFRTPYKWNLDRHYKNHCGSGAFQCAKCNFRADIKQSLTVHEMNHHIPPVGQGAIMARKKNKVGASETTALESDNVDRDELEFLRMETEEAEHVENEESNQKDEDGQKSGEKRNPSKRNLQNLRNVKLSCKRESVNNNLQTDFIHPDDIVPRYGQIYVKTLKCKFCSYKAVFSHELWRHEKRIHDYVRPESKKEKLPVRPPPKLIPLQSKASPTPPSSPILKIPAVRSKAASISDSGGGAHAEEAESPGEKPVNEKEFTEMCKKSCLTSSLKDFVSLIGDEEGLKTIPDSQDDGDLECASWAESCDESDARNNEDSEKKMQTDLFKKKNASFFDKLKEKLLTGTSENSNLLCDHCGHEAKCLSEAVAHQKRHSSGSKSGSEGHAENDIVLSGAELSSTRCQHCRQRCKTSSDLINHLKSCKAFGAAYDQHPKVEENPDGPFKCEEAAFEENVKIEEDDNSMENKVFVWNDLPQMHENPEEEDEVLYEDEAMDNYGQCNEDDFDLDSAQVYGTAVGKGSDNTDTSTPVAEVDSRFSLSAKKVFKCPHCSFWASTASRFHVHIVGHLNKKPFECSLCLYRSNWRWDITKHIRLKSARDPSHLTAKVNMTDETGRRNYSKYNKYLTVMKVQEPSAESSGTGRRSRFCDATQGTAENDVITFPAPPRLTRAPTPGTANQIPQGTPLRPPPPLKAAHQLPPSISKKTLWKCKKCNFRDPNKDVVLSHVKEHYGKKVPASPTSPQSSNADEAEDAGVDLTTDLFHKTPPFRCGHCHQVSNWKHVIQRHCRLKHNGYVLIELDWKEDTHSKQSIDPAMNLDISGSVDESSDIISCDICPFTTDSEGDLTAHKLNHVDRPGSIFKCTLCPFYVPSKIAVLEHMEVHGIETRVHLAGAKIDNFENGDFNEDTFSKNKTDDAEQTKKFKCRYCPYVSKSKTQFLYHKQFHKPRDAPFKCMYCSYKVSRRHLLYQHLRVHEPKQEKKEERKSKKTSHSSEQQNSDFAVDPVPVPEINTADMTVIPLVWVYRSGYFLKMFKCRWCPHVNVRKVNIQEHEKMHRVDGKSDSQKSSKLRCPYCSYVCNNAGVLSSHVKVHQGFYGEIRSLVDPTRTDAEQIENMQNEIRIVEPEVVISEDVESEMGEDRDGTERKTDEEDNSLHAEKACDQSSNKEKQVETNEENKKVLSFCRKCPARFFLKRELKIHSKFHLIRSPFGCPFCSYTARQRPHLLSHYKVHSEEYQRRTAELILSYGVSADNPRQNTIVIAGESDVIDGPVWMLENCPLEKLKSQHKPKANYACDKCPAKFFKPFALQYHLSLHGSLQKHKCKYCDYAVKTYNNLMRHQLVHLEVSKKAALKSKNLGSVPLSGTELFMQRKEAELQGDDLESALKLKPGSGADDVLNKKKSDPLFGSLMHGSPDFIYPTYLKNGKIKEKRYKCHKCPSAFEKRDQYKIHVSLHGSKQKYKCEKCDYSVKYYANYVQHMRKHQNHDEALEARKSESETVHSFEEGSRPSVHDDNQDDFSMEFHSTDKKLSQSYDLTLLEQQTIILHERKKLLENKEEDRKLYWCSYCPYSSNRRDAVDNHKKKHFCVSGIKSSFKCMHCDYMASQINFLRAHNKLHFGRSTRYKAEAYLKCEKMELWCIDDKNKHDHKYGSELRTLVFRDRGENCEDRFFPPIPPQYCEEDEDWKIYVNPETGEPIIEREVLEALSENDAAMDAESEDPLAGDSESGELRNEDLIEMVEEQIEEVHQEEAPLGETPRPKVKRWRGKNWKCKKCPHAFGKKDQYLRHVALHGSNQRHNCDICDYSVKFYTNYVQHMRMHQMHEPNRVIYVKKNGQNLEENAMKLLKEAECRRDIELYMKNVEEMTGYESDSVLSHVGEKTAMEHCEETEVDCSSLTDGTEASISSEDAACQDVVDSSNLTGTGDFANEEKTA